MRYYLSLSCVAVLAAGCDASLSLHAAGGACGSDSDCKAPLVCTNNVCAVSAGSSSGGSDGSADSGATASTGGTSSGSSDGTIITTSSGGSSGGSTGSSGGSTGSTTGAPPKHAQLNIINAVVTLSTSYDLCVANTGDTPTTGISGGVAPGAISLFQTVAGSNSVVITIVAPSDTTCSTPLAAAQTIDLSAADTSYTAVIVDDTSGAGLSVTVVGGTAPSDVANSQINLVNAYAGDTAVSFAQGLPYFPIKSNLAFGALFASESPALSGIILSTNGVYANADFQGVATTANAIETVVLLGDYPGTDPSLLVCNESLAVPTCTPSVNQASAFLRFANLSDPSDGPALSKMTFWVAPTAAPDFSDATPIQLAPGQVGTFQAIDAGIGLKFCVTYFDGDLEPNPGTCAVDGTHTLTFSALSHDGYYTYAAGGNQGSNMIAPQLVVAPPAAVSNLDTLITSVQMLEDNDTSIDLQIPAQLDFYLAQTLTPTASTALDINTNLADDLDGALLVATSHPSENQVGFVFPSLGAAPSSLVALVSGFDHFQHRPNDGSGESGGVTTCFAAIDLGPPSGAAPQFVSVANLSFSVGAVDICANGTLVPDFTAYGPGSVSNYVALPPGTIHLTVNASGAGCGGFDYGAPIAGAYATLLVFGPGVVDAELYVQSPPPQLGATPQLQMAWVDAWTIGDNTLKAKLGTAPLGTGSVNGGLPADSFNQYTSFSVSDTDETIAISKDNFTNVLDTFVFPAAFQFAGGNYTLYALTRSDSTGPTTPPELLLCSSNGPPTGGGMFCQPLSETN